jgi:hypothetical protein
MVGVVVVEEYLVYRCLLLYHSVDFVDLILGVVVVEEYLVYRCLFLYQSVDLVDMILEELYHLI